MNVYNVKLDGGEEFCIKANSFHEAYEKLLTKLNLKKYNYLHEEGYDIKSFDLELTIDF